MRARAVAFALVAVLAVYLVLVGWRGVVLVADGDPATVLLGLAVLVFPVVGAGLVWRELRFGTQTQALAAELERRGALPADDLPRTASGRPDRAAARAVFDQAHAAAQDVPSDPARWYRLALAYDDLGDRRQARASMREALRVWREAGRAGSADPERP
jgi:hypothetical protein